MLNYDSIPLIEFLTKRAIVSCSAAKLLIDAGIYNDAISRLYYAVLYQTKALLLTVNVDVDKHSTAKMMLALHFTKNKRISKETFDIFRDLIKDRHDHFFEVAHDDAHNAYLNAIQFIHNTTDLIEHIVKNIEDEKIYTEQNKE
jgi:uncharacterized protein (UPF0332 family)